MVEHDHHIPKAQVMFSNVLFYATDFPDIKYIHITIVEGRSENQRQKAFFCLN